MMMPTACLEVDAEHHVTGEVLCAESVAERYTSFDFVIYPPQTANAVTCEGTSTSAIHNVNPSSCTVGLGGGTDGYEAVWCGAGCRLWKTLRSRYQHCDAPDAGTPYAVDLSKVLGPVCSSAEANLAPGACCYEPLGYSGGYPFGTDCARACHRAGRFGASNEWCQASNGDHYGNCFCGPKVVLAPDFDMEEPALPAE